MDKYDLLEAMSGIRDEYIEEAAETVSGSVSASAALSHESQLQHTEKEENEEKQVRKKAAASRRRRILRLERLAASVAAILCLSIIVPNVSSGAASAFQGLPLVGNYFRAVTFRTYQYADSTSDAYVEEPGVITMSSGDIKVEDSETYAEEESAPAERSAVTAGAADAGNGAASADPAAVRAALSAAQITEEIRQMACDQISGFEASLAQETGYRSLRFLHETVTDTDKWFCMKAYAYTAAADGFEQVTHFTIDKTTGERVTLESWFGEETDYITPISDSIKTQMREQMKADPELEYWIDSKEEPEYDFTQILPDQDCYFNEDGNLVICFNEGEAAPMYMGTVEFTIPQEVVEGIKP